MAALMISVVIPVANERATIEPLSRGLQQVLDGSYEILFIDDGSSDGTWEEILKLHRAGQVKGIRFRRNFGKTAALQAGFDAARGEVIFTMDGDLQDDPKEIPRFLDKLAEGYDLVSGWKKERQDPIGKVAASRLFNAVTSLVGGVKLHDINCGFKAYRGEVAHALRLQGEMHRFTPLLAHALGYRVGELVVNHHPRRHGRSHYGYERLFKGFLDLITALLLTRYAERPSHGFGVAALVAVGVGFLLLLVSPLWSAAFLIIAVTLLSAGLIGEILGFRIPTDKAGAMSYRIREQLD